MKSTLTKLVIVASILAFTNHSLYSQDAQSLIKIHNISSLSNLNNISSPATGSLAYVTANSTMYQFNGNLWEAIGGDGDAWNVSGEDIGSSISRNGDVGIGTVPTQKLDINGSTRVRNDIVVDGVAYNNVPFNAGSGTTIDFSQSNMAYTTASAGNTFVLNNLKSGGVYTLAVQGNVAGTAQFTSTGKVFRANSIFYPTVPNTHTIYTFIVIDSFVYYFKARGL